MSAAQKAAISMGVREWLEVLSTLLVDDMDSALGEAICDGGEALAEIFEYVDCFTMLALLAKSDDILALQELCCDQLGEPMLQDDVLAELWAHLAPLMDENKSAIAKERKEQASLSKKVKAEHAKEEKQAEKLKRKQQKKDKKKKKKKGKASEPECELEPEPEALPAQAAPEPEPEPELVPDLDEDVPPAGMTKMEEMAWRRKQRMAAASAAAPAAAPSSTAKRRSASAALDVLNNGLPPPPDDAPPPPPDDDDDDDDEAPPPPPDDDDEQQTVVLVLTPQDGAGFGMELDDDGTVMGVHEGSAAEEAGVALLSLILAVDGTEVASKAEIIEVLTRDDAGESSTFEMLLPVDTGES